MPAAEIRHLRGVLRHSRWDGLLIGLSAVHATLLVTTPSIWLIAVGLWWNANTISHNFIHLPFFRSRNLNRLFSAWLTLLLGIPQTLWRERHLAHHADRRWRLHPAGHLAFECSLLVSLWIILIIWAPLFFAAVYLPGIALGLGLCYLQGHFEHRRDPVSHYGRLYNWLFFNDGYHVEHHATPVEHWRNLPRQKAKHVQPSRWPAILRWIELINLTTLENLVLKSTRLQQFVVHRHEQAFRQLWPKLNRFERITIVGGALFPRTALILQRLAPEADIEIVDCRAEHIEQARRFLESRIRFVERRYSPDCQTDERELLIIPLSFQGDKDAVYGMPCSGPRVVHDWIWRRRGKGAVVSWLLLKRLNLVQSATARPLQDRLQLSADLLHSCSV